MNSMALLTVYAVIGSFGLTLMKKGFGSSGISLNRSLVVRFSLYGLSFFIWTKVLKENELSFAFPVASAALVICISMFSAFLLRVHLTFLKCVAMALIVIGILLVSKG